MNTIDTNKTKKANLGKMKNLALSVLILAVVLFFVAHHYEIAWLKAISEAAMVGGIADWFAVVALFKHPLGIPIPHTALIPNNKDDIGRNLGSFVSDEFLIKEKLEIKIDEFDFATKATAWLKSKKNATTVASLVVENVIPGILKTIDDADVQHFIQKQFENKMQQLNFGQWVAIGLESLSKSDKLAQLITNVLTVLASELQASKEEIDERVKTATPWYTLGVADKKIANGVFAGLYEFIEMAKEEDSSIRQRVNKYFLDYIEELKSSPEMQQKISNLVTEFTQKSEVQDYIGSIWQEIKDAVNDDLEKGEASQIKSNLTQMIINFAITIQDDLALTTKINNFIKIDLLNVLLKNKKAIGELIASSVQSWDKKEIADKLELEVGKDLQFIRINGSVVGGFVGLIIYFVEQFI
ncbi:uncharacterized membrane-anchored protein YjiN (DUF445 family) [Flavobacterium sp. PL11]|uniref:DUF445 domain-containing protein n=1 Tax=Flavobacterium sp. PL11 TaxID=3071717 RepID=UPI002DFFE373|nr:uncharacterized membrane-anchored protein YjiN (DUF445 family) [Flavobacterium sp. PL11]